MNKLTPTTSIKILSYGGLVPFLITLAGIIFSSADSRVFFINAFIAYSAVILAFIGAVHWGLIIKNDNASNRSTLLAISVLPALIGWVAMSFPAVLALVIFAFAYPAVFIYERFTNLSVLLPEWYMLIRVQLTLLVTIMQFAAIAWSVS